jgi:hydroxyacylglutathione hydrolase
MKSLYVRVLALGPMKNFVYLVGASDGAEVAVIDPAWDVDAILGAAESDGKRIVCAVATHGHSDHINGLPELIARTGAPAYAQRLELERTPALQQLGAAVRPLGPGDPIPIGQLKATAIHGPGHTPGAQCLLCAGALFTGDVLFVNGCGWCGFPGGDPAAMFHTLNQVLGTLPDETRVFPGHDYGNIPVSTLGRERERNPYLQFRTEAEFVAYRTRPRT